MVLIRARRSKLASTVRQGDSEDGPSAQRQAQVRVRQENRRRAVLYDVSSPSGKRLPSVCLQPADARARRDLMRITQMEDKRMESEKKSAYEAEQNDSKHREHLNYRPPMDHIQNLHDLHTTVAKDCRGRVKLTPEQRMFAKLKQKFGSKQYGEVPDGTKPEWRLGYKNNIDTGSHAGVNGTFEPRDGTRERILDSRSATTLLPSSVAVAYPLKRSKIPVELIWREREDEVDAQVELPSSAESDVDNQVDTIQEKNNERSDPTTPQHRRVVKKAPWCPASASKSPSSSSPRRRYPIERFTPKTFENASISPDQEHESSPSLNSFDHDGLQRYPIRSVEPFEPINDAQEEFTVDARCANRQQTLLTKVADTYARVRARMDRMKDPHLRYELPIEDATEHPRAYRLGLDDVPSTAMKPKKRKEQLKFRPKSAGTSLGFQTGCLGPKAGDLLTPERNGTEKVAGARRRPHSASITYFKSSTVYCMGPSTPSKPGCVSAGTDFRSVVDVECRKRQRDRDAILQKLSTRGLLHSIPLAQIFARLRREGLLNIDRRLQRSIFERMTLDEYMSACGCLNANMTPPLTASDRKQPDSPIKEIKRFSTNLINTELMAASSVDASPSLLATRNALAVSRQQFHLALEAFNLSPTDVNWFFSALDVTVSDRVQVWDAMCSVETLQHEHTALRRARVQQLQAPPSKDLEFFRRQSIT
ncbi:hypothetical protein PF005_g14233 [Phytophthora fragariae]|uniref:Uncharacterized protein n=2 Tax=Phytophthora fragariae TaxID=53985 RepID=A0A6A3RSM2_9STRA|nr:hypothetical protein PF003_g6662 [Phytophthora fragariae]KAE8934516.1 hypothetical protein PF009_g15511 [Phytophthora fragariae]KAE9003476.1 hypothetical protein PF011_g12880 [Phytophthora fragariae]KAE9102906.1 hypothetical protein PF007_g14584 [Phytophthora fragariae]KAE9135807.1 hypothetical protein PF006_g14519 [Phytophthora fragariae]